MPSEAHAKRGGLDRGPLSFWRTTDPLRIAQAQLVALLAALALGVHLALVLRAELTYPAQNLLDREALAGALSAHSLVLVFLFAIPCLPLFLGGLVLPPLVGAKNLAFPGLNRATLKLYLGSFVLFALALAGGKIDDVWNLAPIASAGFSLPHALVALGLHLLGLTLIFQALNLLATVLFERRLPLTLGEMPILVWALTAGAAIQLIFATALASLGILLFLQHATPALVFGGLAGDPLAYERLFSFILHTGAGVLVLPAVGVAFEVVATFSRKAPSGGLSNVLSLAALALLSVGGSGVSLVGDGASPAVLVAGSGLNLLMLLPASVLLFNLLATLAGGSIEMAPPFLHALNLVTFLTVGALGGLFLATLDTGAYLQGSLFASAQLHFLLGGVSLAGLATALYYSWPRLTGRATRESLGRLGALLLFAGFLLSFLPDFVEGSQGSSSLSLLAGQSSSASPSVATLGSLVLVLGLLVMGWDFLSSLLRGVPAQENAWGAATREWTESLEEGGRSPYDFSALFGGASADSE